MGLDDVPGPLSVPLPDCANAGGTVGGTNCCHVVLLFSPIVRKSVMGSWPRDRVQGLGSICLGLSWIQIGQKGKIRIPSTPAAGICPMYCWGVGLA